MLSHWIKLNYSNCVSFRNPMYGKCIKNGAGSFSLLVIASENSMKTSSIKQRWGFPDKNMSMYFPSLLGISNRFLKSPKLCAFWSTKALFLMTQLRFYFLVYLLWEHWSKEQWKITATPENKPTTCAHTQKIPLYITCTHKKRLETAYFWNCQMMPLSIRSHMGWHGSNTHSICLFHHPGRNYI